MMGREHVFSGAWTGAKTAYVLNELPMVTLTPGAMVAFALVSAGAAALNDLDHPQSSASRVLGPVSGLLSDLVQAYARAMYLVTRGPGDPRSRGAHRGATHAIPMLPLPCGVMAVLPHLASRVYPWAGAIMVGAIVGLCVIVAADRMGSRLVAVGLIVAVTGLGVSAGSDLGAALVSAAPWVALAVLVGTITHVLGDLITEYGVPVWAPLHRTNPGTSRERRWVRVQLPSWLAFKTGGWFERIVMFPLLVWLAVTAMPRVWPMVRGVAPELAFGLTVAGFTAIGLIVLALLVAMMRRPERQGILR